MVTFLLAGLVGICLALLLWGLREPGRIYQYPFLAAAVTLGFVVPQLIGLAQNPRLPAGGVEMTAIMTGICLAMCYAGHTAVKYPLTWFRWPFNENRLLIVSTALALLGAYSFSRISRLPEELTSVSQWSGLPVRYLFFAKLIDYGLVIAVLLYFKSKSKWALGIVIFCASFYVDRILIGGRRGVIADIGLMVLLGLWFQQKRILPRLAMVLLLGLGMLFVFSTGDYRATTRRAAGTFRLEDIATIDFVGNFQQVLTEGGTDVRNAVYYIPAVQKRLSFNYGLAHWNDLVFTYVPAQLVGAEFKKSLMIPIEDAAAAAYRVYGYIASLGSTVTGMTEAFAAFWWFGSLEFFVIAFVMTKLYRAAMDGNFVPQVFFTLMIRPAMEVITHGTHRFFTPWVQIAIFLYPVLWWAALGVPDYQIGKKNLKLSDLFSSPEVTLKYRDKAKPRKALAVYQYRDNALSQMMNSPESANHTRDQINIYRGRDLQKIPGHRSRIS